MHKKTTAGIAAAAVLMLGLAGCAGGTSDEKADVTAEPEFSGTLSILTKFAGEPLEPYFEDLIAEYQTEHPDVKFDLIQETDQSIKIKLRRLLPRVHSQISTSRGPVSGVQTLLSQGLPLTSPK